MSKSTTVVKTLREHPEVKPAKQGWEKTIQVQSNGNIRIIASKRPPRSK